MWRACWVVCVILTAGCTSFIEKKAASSTYNILLKSVDVAKRQPDLELARDSMPGGLMQLQTFALAYPHHRGFRTLHADGICQYTIGFVFDDWEDATLGGRDAEAERLATRLGPLLGMCVDANLALLPASWRTARAQGPAAMTTLAAATSREHVGPMLWIATADAIQIALDPLRHLAKLGSTRALLARCVQLAPGFRDAGAELLLGTLEAAGRQLLGGSDGSAQFARARTLVGEGGLMVDVMFARNVAVARKDPALFEATLQRVLAADVTRWPDRRLGNELARRKARRYLAAQATLLPAG
ncbi:MAG: TRAP transporter TatT component family protein [Myxococcota bacterium]|nr:TRAP transporter TatT component family protein [Myxococcota bacterium]